MRFIRLLPGGVLIPHGQYVNFARYGRFYSIQTVSVSGPPKPYLALVKKPNSYLDIGWEGDVGWEGDLNGYSLPNALFATIGAGDWFDSEGNPLTLSKNEILSLSGINSDSGTVFFNDKLVVYQSSLDASTLAKVRRYLNL